MKYLEAENLIKNILQSFLLEKRQNGTMSLNNIWNAVSSCKIACYYRKSLPVLMNMDDIEVPYLIFYSKNSSNRSIKHCSKLESVWNVLEVINFDAVNIDIISALLKLQAFLACIAAYDFYRIVSCLHPCNLITCIDYASSRQTRIKEMSHM